MPVIFSFCAECGALLRRGLGQELVQACENCNRDVSHRHFRIQGVFTESEAIKLYRIHFDEELRI